MFAACFYGALAQYSDGPVPPRIQIPGAISLGPKQGNFRQGRVLAGNPIPAPAGPIRVRRPGQKRAGAFKSVPTPLPYLQPIDDSPKPVTEEPDDIPETTPQPFLSTYTPTQLPQDEISQFLANVSPSPKPISIPNAIPISLPQKAPEPIRTQPIRPLIQNAQPAPARFDAPARPQPVRLAPLSYRPARPQFRPEARPQLDEEDEPEQPLRQSYRPQPTRQPQQQQPAQPAKYQSNTREKKPVAQVIRKYREDNPDGSITWGFENDDGSFKEETIGIDCVTRGRYGYVDPDGMKREYNYETGNPCDKDHKEIQDQQGFIDYQENKAVLPNGVIVDLAAMGKKSKRPQYVRN